MNWETFKKPLIIAHRGFTPGLVENTLEAVEAALKLGCDGVEVDLRMTADGELIVFHDKTFRRLAGTDDVVEEMTLSGIRKIQLQEKSRVPTLEELLDLVRDQLLLNLEIKSSHFFSNRVESKLVSTLRSFRLGPTILLSSFHPLPLLKLKRLGPALKRGYLVCNRFFRTRHRSFLEKLTSPFSLNPSAEMTTRNLVEAAHHAGRRIFVWTVNDEDVMKKFVAMGVDGIFTDRPDLFLK